MHGCAWRVHASLLVYHMNDMEIMPSKSLIIGCTTMHQRMHGCDIY